MDTRDSLDRRGVQLWRACEENKHMYHKTEYMAVRKILQGHDTMSERAGRVSNDREIAGLDNKLGQR